MQFLHCLCAYVWMYLTRLYITWSYLVTYSSTIRHYAAGEYQILLTWLRPSFQVKRWFDIITNRVPYSLHNQQWYSHKNIRVIIYVKISSIQSHINFNVFSSLQYSVLLSQLCYTLQAQKVLLHYINECGINCSLQNFNRNKD